MAPAVSLEHEAVPADQSVAGDPTTAAERLGEIFGVEFGLWEMSAGIMTDVEAEELFVVLSGSATVQVHAANGFDAAVLKLEPGTVCRLSEGMRTTWILDEPLRKLYLTQA
nr:cupin domain-containing protein [Paeniglutamicibacter kerguelensis]